MHNFGNFKDLNDLIGKIEPISGKRLLESVDADSMSDKTADVVVPNLPNDKFVSRKAAGNSPETTPEKPQLGSADSLVEGDVRGMGPTTGLTILYIDKKGNHPPGKTWTQYSRITDPQHLSDLARKHQSLVGEGMERAVGFMIVQLDKNGQIVKEFSDFDEIPSHLVSHLSGKKVLSEAFDDKTQTVDESPMDSAKDDMNDVDKVMDMFNDIFDKKFNPKAVKFDVDSTKQHLEVSDKEIRKIPRGWRNV